MTITAGTHLGSYEVLAPIGSGGMGEVYQAHDTKLGRDVAIKVLPETFAHDPERLSRFQREAKMLASLNHHNIAAIYGLEEDASKSYLVMELVPGETLQERIAREGPLHVEEALGICRQIAEALEAAHEKGIIHRDLKPANVKVTPEGKVKVLDFGLAKAFAGDTATSDPINSPTLSQAATMQGVILGTAAYMSPEQARGKTVDKRTDIWAFGCVLYELLTGKQAFDGEDVTEILAAVVKTEPDWQALPAATPMQVHALLRRCLQKDKALRLRDAGDALIEILTTLEAPQDVGATHGAPVSSSNLLGALAAGLAVFLGVALWGWWRATRPIERPLVRLEVDLGSDLAFGGTGGADVILSPDGTRLAYLSQGRLFTRRLDQPNATELPGTQGASAPFFSPDGRWVAFFLTGKLRKISVDGGAAVSLCDVSIARGGSWGENGNIIAAISSAGGLSQIPSAGGVPTPVTELENGETTHRWPQVLPGSKAVLFTAYSSSSGFDRANIEVISLADHRQKTLQRGGSFGRYLPSGHLVYVNNGTLFAVPFDLERLEMRGTPVPVLEKVKYSTGNGSAELDFSQTGTLVYQSGAREGGVTIQSVDSAGNMHPLLEKPGLYGRPKFSPHGERLALELTDGTGQDIWVYEPKRDNLMRLTSGGGANASPLWSPNGRYIVFQTSEGMAGTLADGSGKLQLLTQNKSLQFPWSFSPDGKRLLYMEPGAGGYHIWTLPLEADASDFHAGKPESFLQTQFDDRYPVLSPDGKWLAYSSNESGTFQVYVTPFPEKNGRWQISNSGGVYPMWSGSGHELFFESLENRIMVAAYSVKGDSLVPDTPRVWSEKQLFNSVGNIKNFDLAPDSKHVAALMPADTAEELKGRSHVIFLENFFYEVRRRTATQDK